MTVLSLTPRRFRPRRGPVAAAALAAGLLPALAAPSAAADNDFAVVPDTRVGPVTKATRKAGLARLFPGAKIQHEEMQDSPCFGEADPVMTFVDGQGWKLAICWVKGRPGTVLADGPKWRGPSGVRPGMTLPEVERLNGKPLKLYGFLGCYLAVGDGGRVKVSVLIGKDEGVCHFPGGDSFSSREVTAERDRYTVRSLGVELN